MTEKGVFQRPKNNYMAKKIVILGAGLSGLSAAYHLQSLNNLRGEKKYFDIYEKKNKSGGLCRTERKGEFLFDYSGHQIHLKNEYVKGLIKKLLKDNIKSHKRNAWVYVINRYTKYPFQANLNALPKNMRDECLSGFYRASVNNRNKENEEFTDFEDWILGRFGEGIAKYFMIPFNKKFWKKDLKEITCTWVDKYIPVPQAEEVKGRFKEGEEKGYGYNIVFQYPKTGGIQALPDALAKEIKQIKLNMEATRLDLQKKIIEFNNNEKVNYDILISTLPLKELLKATINLPEKIKKAGDDLKFNSVLEINLGLRRKDSSMHWVYVPEEKYPFYRFGYFSNFSENMAPKGKGSIYCEISYKGEEIIDQEKTYRDSVKGLIDIGVIKDESEIIEKNILNMEYAYVIYDKEYKNSTEEIHNFLRSLDVFSIGRYGKWEYSAMEDAILQGRDVINFIKLKI